MQRANSGGRIVLVGAGGLATVVGAALAWAQPAPGDGAPPKPAPAAQSPSSGTSDATGENATPAAPDATVPRHVKEFNLGKDGLAIEGYDPVAYFPEGGGEPTKGRAEHQYTYRGATYRFASAEHLEKFRLNPARYEPAHGGWCSTAMAQGMKVEVNPKNFRVHEGRLFLFYSRLLYNARDAWVKDEAQQEPKADGAWERLSKEKPRGDRFVSAPAAEQAPSQAPDDK